MKIWWAKARLDLIFKEENTDDPYRENFNLSLILIDFKYLLNLVIFSLLNWFYKLIIKIKKFNTLGSNINIEKGRKTFCSIV